MIKLTSAEQYELKILQKAEELIQNTPLVELLALKGFKIIPGKTHRYTSNSFKLHFEKNPNNKLSLWSDSSE